MTRLDVAGGGYTEASALLHGGNVGAAWAYRRLTDELTGTAAMAGDSSFADGWAAEYDAAAAAACTAFADVVGALGTLGRYSLASLENHARAERASTFGAVRLVDEVALGTADWVEVAATTPPGVLGGDPSSLPGWANAILDHVEGFVWPDADLDRLRGAAATWRRAGDGLDEAAGYPRRAVNALLTELSPEILPATGAVGRLALAIGELADQCRDLGALCEGYATAVEEQREAILDLVRDLVRDAVAIQVAGFALGFVTFGTANGGAVALNLAKIAAAAPRFKRMLDLLKLYAAGAAEALAGTRLAVVGIGARVRPMSEARLFMTAEVGRVGAKGGRAKSFLWAHEGGPMKAHTIRKHVGKSDDYLRSRLLQGRKQASTFIDEAAAEGSIKQMLTTHAEQITKWLNNPTKHGLPLEGTMPGTVGRVMHADGSIVTTSRSKMVLVQDSTMPDGFRVLTSHPIL